MFNCVDINDLFIYFFQDFVKEWTNAQNRKAKFLHDSLDVTTCNSPHGYKSCDGYAMAMAIDNTVCTETKNVYATVELSGALTRGQMVVDWLGILKKDTNISLTLGLDLKKIEKLFLKIVE